MTGIPGRLLRLWRDISAVRLPVRRPRRMRMVESVPLGEKRFAAILQVDGKEFLVGGGAGSVALLAQLGAMPQDDAKPFANVLEQRGCMPPVEEAAAR